MVEPIQSILVEGARSCVPMGKETGERWDETLECSAKAKIEINFKDNMIGHTTGDTIQGTIDIVLEEEMKFNELIVEFVGLERCHLS